MRLIADKDSIRIARTVLWVMLFQLFSPAILATTSEPEQNGYLATLCTVQGYKTVWVYLDDDESNEVASTFECPYCFFNLVSSDIINLEADTLFELLDVHQNDIPTIQKNFQSGVLLESLPIRGPPLFV